MWMFTRCLATLAAIGMIASCSSDTGSSQSDATNPSTDTGSQTTGGEATGADTTSDATTSDATTSDSTSGDTSGETVGDTGSTADAGTTEDTGSDDTTVSADTGSEDTGSDDTGAEDTGSDDTGADDTGSDDTGSDDTGSDDTGSDDSASEDTGSDDTGSDDTGSDDSGSGDTGSGDSGSGDTGSGDTGSGDTGGPEPDCTPTVAIVPLMDAFTYAGSPLTLTAAVTGSSMDPIEIQWELAGGQVLGTSAVAVDGSSSFDAVGLPGGTTEVRARISTPNGVCADFDAISAIVCQSEVVQNFDAALGVDWTLTGSAFWDVSGWLEMTGPYQGQQGQIYNTTEFIEAGDVSIRFSFATGGGSSPGADGFAMTIIEVDTVPELDSWVAQADGGGGLGYGIGGAYGNFVGDAFTVEIDTWYNQLNSSEKHTDPTQEDHISITLGGDPANDVATFELADVENLTWHDVRVDIKNTTIKVWYDGALQIDQNVPELDFRGGYVWFSGSTGYYTNYHQFDNLKILNNCKP